MVVEHRSLLLRAYVSVVTALGAITIATTLARHRGLPYIRQAPWAYAVFALMVIAAEWRPLAIPTNAGQTDMVASTTFSFALLIAFGLPGTVLAQSAASLLTDVAHRKAASKVLFNVAQYSVAFGGSAVVLHRLGDHPGLTTSTSPAARLGAIVAAGIVYFVVNNVLVGIAVALDQRVRVARHIVDECRSQAVGNVVLLALAPIVVVVAARSLWLVPVLVLPVYLVYKSTQVAIDLEHQARHDALTGLPNRFLFRDRAHQALRMANRIDAGVSVMLLDLDRFKEVNDTLGHAAGDILLEQVGARLSGALREIDSVARLGGDEFAVLVPGLKHPDDAATVACRLLRSLETPFDIEGLPVDVEASIGIARYPNDGVDVDTLLRHADVAMYTAKVSPQMYEFYARDRDHNSRLRLSLLGEMRAALLRGEIVAHYQPKIDLRTGEMIGVEALARWEHPRHGLLNPAEFIPLAENTGLIGQFTRYVLAIAVDQCQEWMAQGLRIPVAVNLSARNLCDANLPADIAALLDGANVAPELLQLEITETTLAADPVRAARTLGALASIGIHIAIDDFGTGYSSLSRLRRLPVREIKIDRSFVANMHTDENDRIIVRSTIDLARNLGLEVTAEGVESSECLALLRHYGCRSAQGYLISRPVPATELGRWARGNVRAPSTVMSPKVSIDLTRLDTLARRAVERQRETTAAPTPVLGAD